ncbi:signal recognition particle protein [Pajaroellobacter abortibovis]|uniref:Signal recognition particle protein n=1 Tax=Pajaroellobacter abortibovis TaxID=1882918 RepID=A0A1L6MVT6_9BACT|nr:signal recognition particle protein [Pajaroellobacter abortibovis]APR99598.1 signal recognition particle protein [Pajaroellobacter abortibovis]
MFDAIAQGFKQAKNKLAGLTELTEQNIETALQEVRTSLLEADVELGVVKAFLHRVKEEAVGEIVRIRGRGTGGQLLRVTAGDRFIKYCYDELVALMSSEGPPLRFAERGRPTGIMMVGLQGAGKTTTCAKLARYLKKQGKEVLLVAADLQRPAAIEQLQILGAQIQVHVFSDPKLTPVEVGRAGLEDAIRRKVDIVIYDTAGRLAIDEPLMQELASLYSLTQPENVFLVVSAMVGQDSVKVSKGFHERLQLTGVILTQLDGDARGGAAVSVKEVTGAPIRFVGVGESVDRLEEFRPDGIASRILGMGDIVGLIKDFEEVVDQKKAARDAMHMLQGHFTLDDFLQQIQVIQRMGPLQEVIGKIPGLSDIIPGNAKLDDRELNRVQVMIQSFTLFEKQDPYVLIREPTRVQRIAKGSGHSEEAVQEFVQQFLVMRQMMAGFMRQTGLFNKLPGFKQLSMVRNLKKQIAQGLEGGGPLAGIGSPFGGGGLPWMGGGGGGLPFGNMSSQESLTKVKSLSSAEKNARKAKRKREKEARRKGRR